MSEYRWAYAPDGSKLYIVGVREDGSLLNPNGYDEELVRAAVAAADERKHARRSKAAKKAAETRCARTERRVYRAADRILAGHSLGPASNCAICGKGLSDEASINRGIGSECWQGVLQVLTARRADQTEDVTPLSNVLEARRTSLRRASTISKAGRKPREMIAHNIPDRARLRRDRTRA